MTEPDGKPFDIAEAIRVAEANARLDLIKRGQILGFAALLAVLAAIIALAAIGQPWVAGILAGVGLAGIVAVFAVMSLRRLAPRMFTLPRSARHHTRMMQVVSLYPPKRHGHALRSASIEPGDSEGTIPDL